MKLMVWGGSPKGGTSVTMQYVRYLAQELPGIEFVVRQPAFEVKRLEKDPAMWQALMEETADADAILWAFPLYVLTVSSQYKRFIELLFERGAAETLRGKYAASLSTSIHFFDHTAHAYIQAVSEDLGLRFAGFFSPKMDDILRPEGRRMLVGFGESLLVAVEGRLEFPRANPPLVERRWEYRPGTEAQSEQLRTDRRVVVLTDSEEGNVGAMIRRFAANFASPPEIVNLSKLKIAGGCLGCLRCGQANRCAYEGKDDFIPMYDGKLKTADVLVFAGAIRDRNLSSLWKLYFDRGFFNTHQRSLPGKQLAFLLSGPLAQIGNLREILTAYADWQRSNLVDIVTDEEGDGGRLDSMIDGLSARLVRAAEAGYLSPATFLGVGGMKIFRDEIYSDLRIVFKADHRAYKKEGLYDFPQRNPLKMLFIRLGYAVTSVAFVYRKMIGNFRNFMLMPYKRLFAEAKRKA